jgi:hypothetical protein
MPDPPTSVVASSINNGYTIRITWDHSGSDGGMVTDYQVYDDNVKTNLINQTGTTSIDISNITPRRSTFQAYVSALNVRGESEVSASNILTIPPAAPLPL